MITKNTEYITNITGLGINGQGIGRIDGFTVFVSNALPGEKVRILIVKVKKNYGYGKLLEIIEPSPFRIKPPCPVAGKCGGCTLQHMDYAYQLEIKRQKVIDDLEHIGGLKNIAVEPVIGMENPYNYRNKAQYPVGIYKNTIVTGFYALGSHRIVPCSDCLIGHKEDSNILKAVTEFAAENNITVYNETEHKGILRHIVIKHGCHTGDIMVCLVVNDKKFRYKDKLVKALEKYNITSLVINYNTSKTNVILGNRCEVISGKEYIRDNIGELKFNISPLSFFQVNPVQTQKLYNKALEFADLKGSETVIDAYCGIGTITLFLAKKAKKVYGVEIVEAAIENAKTNAKLNNILNAEFYTGESEKIIPMLYKEKNISPQVITLDPPRKGCDIKLLEVILQMCPEKIVYVSCDSATLARDLKILTEKYELKKVQPVDMFPHSMNIETVCLLTRIK